MDSVFCMLVTYQRAARATCIRPAPDLHELTSQMGAWRVVGWRLYTLYRQRLASDAWLAHITCPIHGRSSQKGPTYLHLVRTHLGRAQSTFSAPKRNST